MEKWITAILSCLLLACTSQEQPVITLNDEQVRQQQAFLAEAVTDTPYSAVIQLTDVEVQPTKDDPSMQWHIYSANVREVVRGEHTASVRYAMAVEKGEEPVLLKEPILVTLCRTNEDMNVGADYYWPGVGAQFNATPENIAIAKTSAAAASADQADFAYCE